MSRVGNNEERYQQADVQMTVAPGPRGVAERDESSGLQAFKYDGGGWRDSTRKHSPSALSGRARGDQTVAGRVGQTAAGGPGSRVLCRRCCKLIEGAVDEADRCLHAAGSEQLGRAVWPATVMQMTNKSDSGGGCASLQAVSWLSDPPARDPGLPIYTVPAIEPVAALRR